MASTTTSLPTTMRALLQPSPHSTNLTLSQIPLPIPSQTEHLIRVRTTALTNNELHWEALFPSLSVSPAKLTIPCYDMAGTVVSSPPNSRFSPGDEVWARTDYIRSGTAAEYTTAPEKELALRSKRFSWAESATVPMSALTAWQALFVHAGLGAEAGVGARGKRVFVTAASGAVGRWVVQLAKWAGAEVVGTAGGENVGVVKSLGAGEVLDYRKVDVKAWALAENGSRKADLIIDCIGGKSLTDAWWAVKSGGTLISVHSPPAMVKPEGIDDVKEGIKNFFFIMEANGSQLEQITKLIDGGLFEPSLDSVWRLENAAEAVEKLESGKAKGKVVFDLAVET